jgi:hypothetical protein
MKRTNLVKLVALLAIPWLLMLATACGSEQAVPSITGLCLFQRRSRQM